MGKSTDLAAWGLMSTEGQRGVRVSFLEAAWQR
jgi:hypothetical protein